MSDGPGGRMHLHRVGLAMHKLRRTDLLRALRRVRACGYPPPRLWLPQ